MGRHRNKYIKEDVIPRFNPVYSENYKTNKNAEMMHFLPTL